MSLSMKILRDLFAWGAELEEFTMSHAVSALILAHGYMEGLESGDGDRIEGLGAKDDDTKLLLAMDIAWLFWLDDRYDACATRVSDRPPEDHGFARLRSRLLEATNDADAWKLWLDESANVVRGYQENYRLSKGDLSWTYAEYLQNGEASVGVMQCVATISLLYGFDMASRLRDRRFQRLMRNLCLAMRLQNDLVSAKKELSEGDRANAVFFLERAAPPPRALSFITEEQMGYERLLQRDIESLGPDDPFARIARVMLGVTESFYSLARARYTPRRLDPPLFGRISHHAPS